MAKSGPPKGSRPGRREVRCLWCGKLVPLTKKGAPGPHVTPGRKNCAGVGVVSWIYHYGRGRRD